MEAMEGAGVSTAAYREASQKYQHSLQVQEVFAALQVVLDSNIIATRQISTFLITVIVFCFWYLL